MGLNFSKSYWNIYYADNNVEKKNVDANDHSHHFSQAA